MENQQIAQEKSVIAFARSAKAASGILARLTDSEKNAALGLMAERIKERTSEILRRVREEGATFDVTYRGRVVARLAPAQQTKDEIAESLLLLDELEQIGVEISKHLEGPVDAVEIVRDVRRDL